MNTEEKIFIDRAFNNINERSSKYSKIIEATVIFGNPKCNCENYGICKISEGFELYKGLQHKNKAMALLRFGQSRADLSILFNSIPTETKNYQFKNYSFNVISRYTIPKSIISTSKNITFFIRPGLYTYRHTDIFRIKITSENNGLSQNHVTTEMRENDKITD